MSKNTTTPHQCPRCGKTSEITIWQSINVDLDPDLKDKVLDESLFSFRCNSCSFHQGVAYASLYNDMTKQFMVYWIPSDESDLSQQTFDDLQKTVLAKSGYRLRVVPTLNRLKEKILIFDCDLDDRAIELIKRFVWSTRLEDQGILRNRVFFSGMQFKDGYPAIDLVFSTQSNQSRTIQVSGKNAYPRATEILHSDFRVPKIEKPKWKVVDHTYWAIAESGNG